MYRCSRKTCQTTPAAQPAGWGFYIEDEPGSTPKVLCPACSRTYVSGRKRVPDPDNPGKQLLVHVAHESSFSWF